MRVAMQSLRTTTSFTAQSMCMWQKKELLWKLCPHMSGVCVIEAPETKESKEKQK